MIEIPKHINKIKIDIGLSHDAPNSCMWIINQPDTFVIGIEPNRHGVQSLKQNGLRHGRYVVPFHNPNFYLIETAIDDVDTIQTKPFHHTTEIGCSSLFKPVEGFEYKVNDMSEVSVMSLSKVFEQIDWDRFQYVDMLKIDAQGKDLDILKSAGKWLNKCVYIHCETNCSKYYEGAPLAEEYDLYLESAGFRWVMNGSVIDGEAVDKLWVNKNRIYQSEGVSSFVL